MSSIYLAALVALVLTAFLLGRRRAVRRRRGQAKGTTMHSLPAYHGLLAASSVFVAMARGLRGRHAAHVVVGQHQRARRPAPEIAADALKRGAALRDIGNIAAGQPMGAVTPALQAAADTYSRVHALGAMVRVRRGRGVGARRFWRLF